jgi:hypothetical protein
VRGDDVSFVKVKWVVGEFFILFEAAPAPATVVVWLSLANVLGLVYFSVGNYLNTSIIKCSLLPDL